MEEDRLEAYRARRRAGATPEPGVEPGTAETGATSTAGGLFVVHKHAATRLHWDLRLEFEGALASWAVPKGPSLDPTEKRLAVHVEDHPLEYVDFEAVIPEGSYGAGPMIVWDRGTWRPLEDPGRGLEQGKLLFELRGFKLRGVWTLVKLAKGENEWLLIRERRHMSRRERETAEDADDTVPQESVLSGLTVEQLGAAHDPEPALRKELEALEAPARTVRAERVTPMLARTAEGPFDDPDWVFELKLDGYRMLADRIGPAARLRTRRGHDASGAFPELVRALAALPITDFVLDGEVVVHDEAGRPSFQRLQARARERRPRARKRASLRSPAVFYAFDLAGLLGHDLRPLPLLERKRLLRELLPPVGPLRYVEHFPERGVALYEEVTSLRLEGIVGKRAGSRYRGGRSPDWLKVRAERVDDFVVVGWTEPGGSRRGFGALHLAAWDGQELRYAGRVGSGFDDQTLERLREALAELRVDRPPLAEGLPAGTEGTWVEPRIVVQVRYLAWTRDRLLRHAVYAGLREDKPPSEVHFPDDAAAAGEEADFAADAGEAAPAEEVAGAPGLSNPDKVFWPESGYTKRDLYEYYRAVSPWLLPWLRDRPLVLTRYPDGIEGKSFYQKNAPVSTPEWIRTERIPSESAGRELEYFVCDDEASLLYLANLGTIPLHIWGSRVGSLDRPDWCVLDLDPKGAPFAHVVEIARALRALCEAIGLPSYPKTSGSTGLHVLIPLGGGADWEQARTLGHLLALCALRETGGIATVTRSLEGREGRVYIDFLQNRRGQLIASPYSVRPVPGARVSAPLRWREVGARLDPARHTIRSMPRRLARMKEDPAAPALSERPDLGAALERLAERLPEAGEPERAGP